MNTDIEIKILSDKEMQTIPIGCQATAFSVIERILREILEENPDVKLSELL